MRPGFRNVVLLAVLVLFTGALAAAQTPSHPLSQITPTDSNLNFSNNDNVQGYNITHLPWLNPFGTTLDIGGTVDLNSNPLQNPSSITNYYGSACSSGEAVQDVGDDGSFTCVNLESTTFDTFVNITGDTMEGNLSFDSSYWIKGLRDPVSSQDAMTKSFADSAYLNRDGTDSMTGSLDMSGYNILNVDALGNGTVRTIEMDTNGNVNMPNGILSVDNVNPNSGELCLGDECA